MNDLFLWFWFEMALWGPLWPFMLPAWAWMLYRCTWVPARWATSSWRAVRRAECKRRWTRRESE